ncbi:MAG: phosphate ABC transporter permease subunit PstC [Erysipelotrichaceae bacterium]
MKTSAQKNRGDQLFKILTIAFTSISIIALFSIIFFTFVRALPLFKEVNFFDFLFGQTWNPSNNIFGILPFVVASILSTLTAVLFGIPIGLLTAVFIAEIAPKKVGAIVLTFVDILAAIPSIVYGFIGLVVVVPWVQKIFDLRSGSTLLTASMILTIMIIPTVVVLSAQSMKQVPKEIKEGSLALGATKIQTIFKAIIPSAKSGIITSFLLGLGRALGETMAVILVAGNATRMPVLNPISEAFLNGVRTLTGNIVLELDYAAGLHQNALFATGVVLFIFVSLLNLAILRINKRKVV